MGIVTASNALPDGSADAFWLRVTMGECVSDLPELRILPILISIHQWTCPLSWRQRLKSCGQMEQYIRSILLDSIPDSGLVRLGEQRFLAVCSPAEMFPADRAAEICRDLVSICQDELSAVVSCCVGTVTMPLRLPEMTDRLMELDSENVSEQPLCFLGGAIGTPVDLKDCIDQGIQMLRNDRFDDFLEYIYRSLMADQPYLSSAALNSFTQDMLQMLYTVMHEKSVAAHVLFTRPESLQQFRDAPLSVSSTITWLYGAVTSLSEALKERKDSQNYTEQTKTFIRSHLRESLTRQDIADHVHLSQNHLARLFRKETGMSIAEFTLQERMKTAVNLLLETGLSVGEIAHRVGYENYSYFLTLFHRVTGQTPSEYRTRHRAHERKEEHS